MSCRLAHNTNLSLISVQLESLGGGVISFSSVQMPFSPLYPCLVWYINLHPSNGAGIFRQLNAGPLSSPCKWSELAKRPCYGWVTDSGGGGGGGANTHLLSKSLVNCSPSMIGHYIIDSLFVQDSEKSI